MVNERNGLKALTGKTRIRSYPRRLHTRSRTEGKSRCLYLHKIPASKIIMQVGKRKPYRSAIVRATRSCCRIKEIIGAEHMTMHYKLSMFSVYLQTVQ